MHEFIKISHHNLPPQGLKILCFNKGDLWVARRLRYKEQNYWIEIPYGGKNGAILTDEPSYWMPLNLPEGCTGYIQVGISGENPMTLDELQIQHPKLHEYFVKEMIKGCINYKKVTK